MEIPYLKNSLEDSEVREGLGPQGSLREAGDADMDDIADADEQVDSGASRTHTIPPGLFLPLLLFFSTI